MSRECDVCKLPVPMGHGAHMEIDHMNNPGEFGWYCDDCAKEMA